MQVVVCVLSVAIVPSLSLRANTRQASRQAATSADDSVLTDIARLASASDDRLVGAYVVFKNGHVADTIDHANFWLTDGKTPDRVLVELRAPVKVAVTRGQEICLEGIVLHIPDSLRDSLQDLGWGVKDEVLYVYASSVGC